MLATTPKLLLALLMGLAGAACEAQDGRAAQGQPGMKITIKLPEKTLTATLEKNAATDKLATLLPLKVKMVELNGNEKYSRLSARLPTNATRPRKIKAGDLMLYGDDTLVLFYETFDTSYTYTRLGQIDDSSGIAAAVGSGDVPVTIERAAD